MDSGGDGVVELALKDPIPIVFPTLDVQLC